MKIDIRKGKYARKYTCGNEQSVYLNGVHFIPSTILMIDGDCTILTKKYIKEFKTWEIERINIDIDMQNYLLSI